MLCLANWDWGSDCRDGGHKATGHKVISAYFRSFYRARKGKTPRVSTFPFGMC